MWKEVEGYFMAQKCWAMGFSVQVECNTEAKVNEKQICLAFSCWVVVKLDVGCWLRKRDRQNENKAKESLPSASGNQ